MSYFKQNKTILWILLAVILFNIAAIVTIYYKMNCTSCKNPRMEEKGCFQSYLKKELNLTPAQAEKFDAEKNRYHDTVMTVHKLMIAKKEFISAEMIKPNPDTAVLNKASDELGMLYAKTRKLYLNHYFELTKICNPQQKAKLSSIIGNVFCCEGRGEGIGPENDQRKHHENCNAMEHGKY